MSNYNKRPALYVENSEGRVFRGNREIQDCLRAELSGDSRTLIVETYPGASLDNIRRLIEELAPDLIVSAEDILKDADTLKILLDNILTDDRVFGRMYSGELTDFVDPVKVDYLRAKIANTGGKIAVYGFGASLLADEGLCVYADMSRWEIQLRYRAGMSCYFTDKPDEDILKKFKQGYFLEWRIADKWKMAFMDKMQYFIDANRDDDFVMIRKDLFEEALSKEVSGPFRVVPYFDPGVWGGQWMKKVCGLDPEADNYAWSFDGVPEENSLLFDFGNGIFELPAMDLVLTYPRQLLGEKVYSRFGAEFPIRFDFLDTIGGQNLSLQVHPVTDYIRRQFGMAYTQDESYYILDAAEEASVYLGLRQDADPGQMFAELERANRGECLFDAEKYVNRFPARKHDHFLIPAGTCHGAGSGTMVLEISATPYIFTFKLWDWGRLGLDGKPRPVHLEHGRQVLRTDRKYDWVKKNLVNAVHIVNDNDDYTEEHTGLHELEFIETRRYTIRGKADLDTEGSVNMLNLVEGSAAVIESPAGGFEPYTVHYAETFILPAKVGPFTIRPANKDETIIVIRAHVRT